MVISLKEHTSITKTLSEIRSEIEANRKALVGDLKKANKKELAELPDTLSQKEKTDYLYKVQPHFDQIYKLIARGYKRADIADTLGITQVAFRRMCREVPELRTLIDIGVEDKIDEVEASLYQLAHGFSAEEEVINAFDGSKETLTKYHPPVLGAIKYVLGSKRGEEYAEKKQIIKKIELGQDVKTALMSIEVDDLRLALRLADAQANALDAEYTEKETGDYDGE